MTSLIKAEELHCREDEVKVKEDQKKTRLQQADVEAKALAALDAKASCFEENDYKGATVQDLSALLAWYNIKKEMLKKSEMVARWKEICINHVTLPMFERWTPQDEEELEQLKMAEIELAESMLGCYAALMKRTAVTSVLDFTDEEWESLLKLKAETSTKVTSTTVAMDESWMDTITNTVDMGDLGFLGTNYSVSGSNNYQGLV